MRILSSEDVRSSARKIAIYGDPKSGKTRLATSLPWGEYWGERAVYVAWDPGSEDLSSVLPENRDRLLVVTPEASAGAKFDPLEEATAIASRNWLAEEGVRTLIWDTMTYTATDILSAVSALGLYGSGVSVGSRKSGSFVPQPQMGDYRTAQACVMHTLDFLFGQSGLNVIVLFHSVMTDPEGGGGETIGGPATVGKAGIRPISGLFDNLFRVAIKRTRVGTGLPAQYVKRRVVQTETADNWLAGLRSGHAKNPISEYELTENSVAFWQALDETTKGEK